MHGPGEWTAEGLASRIEGTLRPAPTARTRLALARAVLAKLPDVPRDPFTIVEVLLASSAFERVTRDPRELHHYPIEKRSFPTGAPPLDTVDDVARWLEIANIGWYADPAQRNPRERARPKLSHYSSRWVRKRGGGLRLIESPKHALKLAQRCILRELLDHIAPHPAAVGFRRGGSILLHASAHAGRRLVLRLDLEDFFGRVTVARVAGIYRMAGYSREVAYVLALLCTTRTSHAALELAPLPLSPGALARLRDRHLPQGSPTSPALANLAAFRLDVRLDALARSIGASYTRYADDLAFSGDLSYRAASRLEARVASIAIEEGFGLQHHKTRAMGASRRQHLTGLVVNTLPSIARTELERLEAILVNCARLGPSIQNREDHREFRAHLEGRVAFVAHVRPDKAVKLRTWLERIDWTR